VQEARPLPLFVRGTSVPRYRNRGAQPAAGTGESPHRDDCDDNSEFPRLAYRSLMLAEERDEIDRAGRGSCLPQGRSAGHFRRPETDVARAVKRIREMNRGILPAIRPFPRARPQKRMRSRDSPRFVAIRAIIINVCGSRVRELTRQTKSVINHP